jgi:hypothetical protein
MMHGLTNLKKYSIAVDKGSKPTERRFRQNPCLIKEFI